MRIYVIFAFLMLLSFPANAYAGNQTVNNGNGFGGLVEEISGSSVNWGDGFLSATSEILPMQDTIDPVRTRALALRQGGVEARKILLDATMDLTLDGRKRVASVLRNDLKAMNSLRGFVQNSLLSTEMTPNATVKVTASLNVHDGLSAIIIPPTIPFLSGIPPTISGKRTEVAAVQELAENGEIDEREAAVHSGVVIDARGFAVKPVLLPVVFDGRGVGVYGAFAVSRDAALKLGLVSYMIDENSENMRSRVGNFPLTVKPVNTHGAAHANLILSLEDAAKVRAVLKRKSVIENCAVVVLVDDPSSVGKSAEILSEDETVPLDEKSGDGIDSEIYEDSLDENSSVQDQQ